MNRALFALFLFGIGVLAVLAGCATIYCPPFESMNNCRSVP